MTLSSSHRYGLLSMRMQVMRIIRGAYRARLAYPFRGQLGMSLFMLPRLAAILALRP